MIYFYLLIIIFHNCSASQNKNINLKVVETILDIQKKEITKKLVLLQALQALQRQQQQILQNFLIGSSLNFINLQFRSKEEIEKRKIEKEAEEKRKIEGIINKAINNELGSNRKTRFDNFNNNDLLLYMTDAFLEETEDIQSDETYEKEKRKQWHKIMLHELHGKTKTYFYEQINVIVIKKSLQNLGYEFYLEGNVSEKLDGKIRMEPNEKSMAINDLLGFNEKNTTSLHNFMANLYNNKSYIMKEIIDASNKYNLKNNCEEKIREFFHKKMNKFEEKEEFPLTKKIKTK